MAADQLERLKTAFAVTSGTQFGPLNGSDIGPPAPDKPKGDGKLPVRKKDTGSERDKFLSDADRIEKRTAALDAETAAIDLGTAARNKAKIAAELETVAKQVNAAAGLGANIITKEQRERIDALAEAYGRVAAKSEQAHSPLATFARESANLNKQLNQSGATALDGLTTGLASIVTGSKTAADAFKTLADSIINDLAKIAIKQAITGPLASLLFGSLGGTSGASSISLPKFAGGTNNAPGGFSLVGENGPELVNLPRGAQVVPNDVLRNNDGGGMNVTYAPSYTLHGTAEEIRQIKMQAAQDRADFSSNVVSTVRRARTSRAL